MRPAWKTIRELKPGRGFLEYIPPELRPFLKRKDPKYPSYEGALMIPKKFGGKRVHLHAWTHKENGYVFLNICISQKGRKLLVPELIRLAMPARKASERVIARVIAREKKLAAPPVEVKRGDII
jgi:hypothetical protein